MGFQCLEKYIVSNMSLFGVNGCMMDDAILCPFQTVFLSHQDVMSKIMIECVQWNPIYS